MKIAIFSDIHGNLPALKAILDDIKAEKVDEIIFLGDAIAMGPCPKECLELIKNSNVTYISGNHELYYAYGVEIDDEMGDNEKSHQAWIKSLLGNDYVDYLRSCPLIITKDINGKNIIFNTF